MNESIRMVVFGDSVPWGQGHWEKDKYRRKVERALGASAVNYSHSGATIGVGDQTVEAPCNGEVPVTHPTILKQCERFNDDPASVRIILVNGGINDVNIRVIMFPLTTSEYLSRQIRRYCHDDMCNLLYQIAAKFSHPDATIILTGYYPIVSPESDPFAVEKYLNALCITIPIFMDRGLVLNRVVENSMQFWHESTRCLKAAVDEVNQNSPGQPRIRFINVPFQPKNSMYASDPWLFELNKDLILSPQDPVAEIRAPFCNECFKYDLVAREQCYRASAGHPNLLGSDEFAKAILHTVRTASV